MRKEMEFRLLGFPEADETLELDYRVFAYAGKFVMSKTGKSVAVEDGTVVGAVAFSGDHDDSSVGHLRYVTVRDDRQGEGIGSRLLRFTAETLADNRYDRVVIAVNNPVAYRACYRAGFRFTGHETGIAELVMEYDPSGDTDGYQDGLDIFRGRELPPEQQQVLEVSEPPETVQLPERDGGD